MGLIRSAKDAISSTLADQWKEAIRCDDINNDILMVKRTTPNGVISNGSTIVVAPGQCAVIFDNGRVIDATAEDGVYTFDTASTPSFFAGQFKETFKEMWQRFTYNGVTSKEQAVYFFNIKEIIDNKFGTATPVPFQDWSHPIPNRMTNTISPLSVKIRCYGTYTFKIDNPAIFMQELAGTANIFYKSEILDQIRSEVMASFQNVLNELGNSVHKVPVLEMPSQTDEMKQMMDAQVFDEPIRRRGLRLISFSVESVTLEEESEKKINDYELSSNSYMQQGRMTEAYANAVENAAQNANGVANGFMGIGMVNMMSGGMVGGAANAPWQNAGMEQNAQTYDPYANNQQANTQIPAQPDMQPQVQPVVEEQTQPTTVQEPIQNTVEEIKQEPTITHEEPIEAEPNGVPQSGENNQQPVTEPVLQPETTVPLETSNNDHNVSESVSLKMCKKCGNMNPANSKFCNNCGNSLY